MFLNCEVGAQQPPRQLNGRLMYDPLVFAATRCGVVSNVDLARESNAELDIFFLGGCEQQIDQN